MDQNLKLFIMNEFQERFYAKFKPFFTLVEDNFEYAIGPSYNRTYLNFSFPSRYSIKDIITQNNLYNEIIDKIDLQIEALFSNVIYHLLNWPYFNYIEEYKIGIDNFEEFFCEYCLKHEIPNKFNVNQKSFNDESKIMIIFQKNTQNQKRMHDILFISRQLKPFVPKKNFLFIELQNKDSGTMFIYRNYELRYKFSFLILVDREASNTNVDINVFYNTPFNAGISHKVPFELSKLDKEITNDIEYAIKVEKQIILIDEKIANRFHIQM